MKKKIFAFYLVLVVLVLPAMVIAGGLNIPPAPRDTLNITSLINGVFSIVWYAFAAFAVFAFLYAGFLFLNSHGDATKAKEARMAVIWGCVGIVVGLLSISIPWLIKSLLNV